MWASNFREESRVSSRFMQLKHELLWCKRTELFWIFNISIVVLIWLKEILLWIDLGEGSMVPRKGVVHSFVRVYDLNGES